MSLKKGLIAESYSPSISRYAPAPILVILLFFFAPLSAIAYDILLGCGDV
jgi:hypothetical protein